MITIRSITELRQAIRQRRQQGQSIGFVPTMGNLHEGHLQLVTAAKQQCDCVVTSIYVNPTQFGPNEDFDNYPRTEERDSQQLASVNNDLLFLPNTDTIYPNGKPPEVTIDLPTLSNLLCGASRPGHFGGVALVVTKLFNIVQPDTAFFGQKDFQQLLIIKRLVRELMLPVAIMGVPTVREPNGLAMSSRNQYLTDEEKHQAGQLYQALTETASALKKGTLPLSSQALQQHTQSVIEQLSAAGFEPDYFEIRNQVNLATPQAENKQLVLLIAAKLGKARLIDNLSIDL